MYRYIVNIELQHKIQSRRQPLTNSKTLIKRCINITNVHLQHVNIGQIMNEPQNQLRFLQTQFERDTNVMKISQKPERMKAIISINHLTVVYLYLPFHPQRSENWHQ